MKTLYNMCPVVDESVAEQAMQDTLPLADEIIPIVKTGPSANRIDVVLMGDGYTASQRDLFVSDITRLVKEMFEDITFKSYLPLFNIWALYRPSTDSGIGSGGVPKNTAFGLYRDGTELRGIYCSKTSTARSACTATGACDFPTLIGNDPYYGGLGGEFTISTSSVNSGTVVLRHEMGHNFGQVGEEYDGGSAYFGANSAGTVNSLQWTAWLTDPSRLVAEQSLQRIQSYAWYDLAKGPFTITFTSDGTYSRAYLIFSASGCEVAGAIRVTLDGKDLTWTPFLPDNLDRFFYSYYWDTGLSAGTHTLVFTQLLPPKSGSIRQLCNVNMHEYKAEPLYHFNNSYIGAYPTWNSAGRVSYRPDNELCLMRNMSSPVFCPVCQETIWIQFFKRVSLIDNLTITDVPPNAVAVSVGLLPLGEQRDDPVPGESLTISWYQNNQLVPALNNLILWTQLRSSATGSWRVQVKFTTLEVRSDPTNLLTSSKTFTI